MNLLHAPRETTERSELRSEMDMHMRSRWLLIARITWVALVVLTLSAFFVGLPIYFTHLQTACVDTGTCALNGALNPAGIRALQNLGFSLSGYAAYMVTLYVLVSLVWLVVGLLIFWRKSDDLMALFVALFLATYIPGIQYGPAYALAMVYPAWDLPGKFLSLLVLISIGLFLCLFPNGRFVPRWTRWLIVAGIVWLIPIDFFPDSPFSSSNLPPLLASIVWLFFLGSLVFAQIYRYRRVSTPVQRQQTKWVVFGGTAAMVGVAVLELSHLIVFRRAGSIYELINLTGYLIVLLPIPFCIGIAILRYRLWDIDVIINRTLVYGTLTGLLVLVYVGLVIGLQILLHGLTGGNDLAIIASTLVIAALFQPLRGRVQAIIDRRFYRRKYDASKTVAAFSSTLRQEVDLDQLREQLLVVVQETMQPTFVSLWLPKPKPRFPLARNGSHAGTAVHKQLAGVEHSSSERPGT